MTIEEIKALGYARTYGARGLVGLIVPSVNINCEPEFHRLMPRGVTVHTARVLSDGAVTQAHYDTMAAGTTDAARLLGTASPDLIVYACTSGSLLCDRESIKAEMTRVSGTPVTTTIDAVLEALAMFGAKSIALATPYRQFVTDGEIAFLEQNGYRVRSALGLDLGRTHEEKLLLHRVPPESIRQLALAADSREADVLFLSCTGFGALDVIDRLEAELGKPVITSNQATIWHCLRRLGLADRIDGHGRLLREF
ncbi:MAG: aspartate/glutamate racemase family protein [Burkholderiaceae bacterium]